MNSILTIIAGLFILLGLFFISVGIIGLFKMKNIYNKQHSSGLIDTIGVFSICIGLSIMGGAHLYSIKPLMIAIIMAVMSPFITYAIMQIAIKKDNIKTNKES